jgi:signal transduction histidine kinase
LRRGAERGGFKARFKSKIKVGDLDHLSMVEQSLLYRLVQESITNICKHAQASEVRANIEISRGHLLIQVIDNGKGIEFGKLKEDSRGVRYMRQRGDLIGAKIIWTPAEGGRGTMVEIRMDLAGRENGQDSSS